MYLPIKWGVKEPQRILKITQELTCRPWKVRGPQLGKDRLPVPVYYTLDLPPKNPGCNPHHQDDIGMARDGSPKWQTFFGHEPASWGVISKFYTCPKESSNLKFLLSDWEIHPSQKNPATHPYKRESNHQTPPEFGGSIVDSHPFFGWFSPGGNWGFSFGVGLTPGWVFMKIPLRHWAVVAACGW